MIGIVLLAAFSHLAASQSTYDCQCAFFVVEQGPGQVGEAAPIPFKSQTAQVDPYVCLEETAGNNTCKYICDEWGRQLVEEGWGLCDAPDSGNTTGIERCYGGLYCEGLYQDNRVPAEGLSTSIRTWYRIPECADSSDFTEWNLGSYEYPEALCCSGFGTYDSCYDACECVKADPFRYCECGVFTTVQFIFGNNVTDPLPFKMVSSTVGDTPLSFCDNYIVDAPSEECEEACSATGGDYFAGYSLTDSASAQYNVDEDITYGQLYCNTLRSRRIFFDQYINTELRVFKRAPLCYFPPTDARWQNMFPQVDHPERLCCNEEGVFEFPCIPPAQDNVL